MVEANETTAQYTVQALKLCTEIDVKNPENSKSHTSIYTTVRNNMDKGHARTLLTWATKMDYMDYSLQNAMSR